MNVGKRIKERRQQLGMNAETLAAKIGVSASTIYRYENGGIDKVDASKLIPIAEALYTTPSYLMGWEDRKEDPAPPHTTDPDDWIVLAPGFDKLPPEVQQIAKSAVASVYEGIVKTALKNEEERKDEK